MAYPWSSWCVFSIEKTRNLDQGPPSCFHKQIFINNEHLEVLACCCYVDRELKECEGATLCTKGHETYGSVSCNAHGQDLPWTRPGSTRRSRPQLLLLLESPPVQKSISQALSSFFMSQSKTALKNHKHILSRWDIGLAAEAPTMCWRRPAHYQREGRRYKYVRRIFKFQFSCICCVPECNWHGLYPDLIPKDNKAFSY